MSARCSARNSTCLRAWPRRKLAEFGEIHTPSVADIFVAKVKGAMQ